MKKILLLLVGAIVAFATHAQYYVAFQIGSAGGTGSTTNEVSSSTGECEWSNLKIGTSGFQIKCWDGSKNTYYGGVTVAQNAWTELNASPSGNATIQGATADQVFNVKFNVTNKSVYIEPVGGDTPVNNYTYAVKGNFGDLADSWSSLPEFDKTTLISTYDFGSEGKKGGSFGVQQLQNGSQVGWFWAASGTDANYYSANSGKTFTLVKEKDSNGSNLALKDDKLYGVVTFKLTLDADGIPTNLIITGGAKEGGDTYTFALFNGDNKLYDFTGSNPYEVNYTISAPLAADTPLCVKRIKNGTVENTYGLANAATYNGTKLDNATLQQDGASLVLAATLEGAVTFTLNVTDNVPTSLTVSGGQLHQTEFKDFWLIGKFNGWSPKDEAYHFETTDGKTYTYTAVNEIKSNPGGDGDAGWKINEGTWDNGYEVFGKVAGTSIEYNTVFNLTTSRDAANLEKDIPAGAKMTLTYNPGGTSTLLITTKEEPVIPVEPAPTTLYIQMKYDYATQAADAPKIEDDPVPNPVRCHIYNSATGVSKYNFGSEEEKMDRVSFRFSLWKFELTEDDVEKYDAVDFYIYTTKNEQTGAYENPIEYCSDIAFYKKDGVRYEAKIDWYDKTNWTRFIYATATKAKHSPDDGNPSRYACQSMLSYSDFNALNERDAANGGRSFLYLVGWGVTFDAEDANGNVTEDHKSMPGTPATAYALPADNGCFYLPTYKPGNSDEGKFKVSFVNTAEASKQMSRFGGNAKNLADSYDEGSLGCPRHWATFDLGLVGVDTRFDYSKYPGSWIPTYASGSAGSPGSVNLVVNRSVKYNNVNQGDWIIPKDTEKDKNYFVFDSHEKCMSVSFIDFNPHPTVVAEDCDVMTATLSNSDALLLHDHNADRHLDAAGVNGCVYVNKVNYIDAIVNITPAEGNTLTDMDQALGKPRYKATYSLLLNGDDLALNDGDQVEKGRYKIPFLPVSNDNSIQIRGKYTNQANNLTFHSRTSHADLQEMVAFVDPAPVTCNGQYVVNKNVATDGGAATYGVYVKDDFVFGLEDEANAVTDLHYYADFDVAGAEIIHADHYLAKYNVATGFGSWVKNTDCADESWFEGNYDWSSMMKAGTAVPFYIPEVETASDPKDLPSKSITGTVKAVFPFLIAPKATITKVEAANGPKRAMNNNNVSIEDKELNYVPRTATAIINVANDNVISGVEGVAVDAVAEGDVEYYTISGVRVYGEPAPGIYLRRQGNTVAKVVIR